MKNQVKHLSIVVSEHFTWKERIEQFCKKLSTSVFVIIIIKQISSKETFHYFRHISVIRPSTMGRYGQQKHGEYSQASKTSNKILIGTAFSRNMSRTIFKKLQTLTVVNLYTLEKILHQHSAQSRNRDLHQQQTQTSLYFTLPLHHLSLSKQKP